MEDCTICVRGVSKTYHRRIIPVDRLQDRLLTWRRHRKDMHIRALRDASVSVRRGEWLGLYGPNGSGKSTLLKVIAGLLKPDNGSVVVDGTLSSFFELGIGFHPELHAYENIRLHALLQGFSRFEIPHLTRRIIDFAGIGDHAALPLKCYSTGMKLRLSFAAASQIDADIYLFDEVFAVGDAAFQKQCLGFFDALRNAGKTVILVSHGLEGLAIHCDRILFFDHGEIIREERNGIVSRFGSMVRSIRSEVRKLWKGNQCCVAHVSGQ
ncbi:MAG: ATP-binding cassette domain-containing protein [Candidatus Peribacteraceae bacterium]|nr:ATP-binding cassette domain-containing protein [Candidatus Peribacteraceae bacterium]